MKRIAVILALLLAAGSISACVQEEIHTDSNVSKASEALESTVHTVDFDNGITESEMVKQPFTSASQAPTYAQEPTVSTETPAYQQSRSSENSDRASESGKTTDTTESTTSKQSQTSVPNTTPKVTEPPKPKEVPKPKPNEATKPQIKPTEPQKPRETEPPIQKQEIDCSRLVSALVAYGQQCGMVYNSSLGIGNAGWFPPTDISGYTDTDVAVADCYGDVDYVSYYFAGLGAEPADITFNVIVSGGQLYVVYA